ncbi:MAG TPA: PAS domain S-box protein [Lacunisphaera sp.]|nr:PAS domain S-box protein [Lacunisphaera sp.]
MSRPLQILIAEDNAADAELLVRALHRSGFTPQWSRVDTEAGFLESLHDRLELVISDYEMPQFTGPRALELTRARFPDLPFIIISGTIGEETAVEAMRLGATDYLLKDRLVRLGPAVNRALGEAQLRRERRLMEEDFRLLFAQNPMPMWVYDIETLGFLAVNDAAVAHYGYARTEFLQMTLKDIRPPEDVPRLLQAVRDRRDGMTRTGLWRHRRKDGTELIVEPTAHRTTFQGRPAELVLAHDVTDRLATEQALRDSESRLRIVTDNARIGLVMVDPEHRYVFANATYSELLGLPAREIVGERVADVLAPIYEEQIRRRLAEAFAGSRVAFELTRPLPDGARHYAVRYEPTQVDGKVALVVVVLTDVTERRRAEQAIRDQLDELRRWHEVTLGRERRIMELKREVNALLAERQQPARYATEDP